MDDRNMVAISRVEYDMLLKKATALNIVFAAYDEEHTWAVGEAVKVIRNAFAEEVI